MGGSGSIRKYGFEIIKPGLYAGLAAVFMSVIGMVESFQSRDLIIGVVGLGHSLILIAAGAGGYFSARRMVKFDNHLRGRDSIIGVSLASGLLVGALLGAIVALSIIINLRPIFINVSPSLLQILTLGVPGFAGAAIPLLYGTIMGGVGGVIFMIPRSARRHLLTGLLWFILFGLLSEIVRVSTAFLPRRFTRLFVASAGLKPFGAAIVFSLATIASYLSKPLQGQFYSLIGGLQPSGKRLYNFSKWTLFVLFLLVLPRFVGRVASDVLVTVGIYVLMGFGLNIVVGKAGLLDLGYVAFFAIGAYSTAVLTSVDELPALVLSFWLALPIVILITGIAGVLVGAPVLRMRGDYLAIVTLGFGEIARFLALSDWLIPVIGGAQGVVQIPNIRIGSIELVGPQDLYYIILVFSLVALFVSWRLEDSRVGRAWVAMREDETVAEVMGINTVYYKLLAFAMGAMIASLGGAVFAIKLSAIFPHSFDVIVSITTLSLLIIGGLGSLKGVIVGALALVGLPELLREFQDYRLLLYGAVLVIMMLARPQGLVPSDRREREITEEERAQDAYLPAD